MKRIYILEGCDGAGKSTLAEAIGKRLSVPVTHHGSYKGEHQVWRHYFDSMLPAYSDACDVVLDRSWISEPIYGLVYRGGAVRIEPWQLRILEYVVKECETTVVWCVPPFVRCLATFAARREQEMLDSEEQLQKVYDLYAKESRRQYVGVRYYFHDYTKAHGMQSEQIDNIIMGDY